MPPLDGMTMAENGISINHYVLACLSGAEKAICNFAIKNELNAWYPISRYYEPRPRRIKGQPRVITERPLMPGYIFIGYTGIPYFGLFASEFTPSGVFGFLGDGTPETIPIGKIDELREREAAGEWDSTRKQDKQAIKKARSFRLHKDDASAIIQRLFGLNQDTLTQDH